MTTTGATLNGTVNAEGSSTTVTFQYGLTTAYGTTVTAAQSPVGGTSDTAVSRSIGGLADHTTYHYRVVAQNINGVAYGDDMIFVTGEPITPSAVTNAATGVSGTAATLNGTVNAGNAKTTVSFQCGLDTTYGHTTLADPSPVSGTSDTAVSGMLVALIPDTTYHYRVMIQSVYGTLYGADMTFTTRAITPTAVTGNASGVTTTAAILNGVVNANNADTTVTFEYGLDTTYGATIAAEPGLGLRARRCGRQQGDIGPAAQHHLPLPGSGPERQRHHLWSRQNLLHRRPGAPSRPPPWSR